MDGCLIRVSLLGLDIYWTILILATYWLLLLLTANVGVEEYRWNERQILITH